MGGYAESYGCSGQKMSLFAEVVLPVPLRKSFFYIIPEKYREKTKKGARVLVSFRKNLLTGYVIGIKKEVSTPNIELKEIKELLDEKPVFSDSFLSFTKRLSDYYYSSWGEMLQISLPPSFSVKTRTLITISEQGEKQLGQESCRGAERQILQFLSREPYTELYLRRKFQISRFSSLISNMRQKGWINIQRELKRSPKRESIAVQSSPAQLEMDYSLDSETRKTADKIRKNIGKDEFLLFMVYASPIKREAVYLYLIKEALSLGLKVLFLTPEIEFTDRILKNFQHKLGENAAFLHSRLSERQRELTWKRIKSGEAEVIVGPRSVLLSPVQGVGLIILDEEPDDSYYQKENPVYDARVGARLRAEQEKAVLVYGSETPSVELLYKSSQDEGLLNLEGDVKTRFKRDIIDSRRQTGILSRSMKQGIEERISKKQPVLLFFNRYGYTSSLVCSKCDFTPKCKNCDIQLTYFKKEKKLICRYCHYSMDLFEKCPVCGSRMVPGGGFGIEVLEEELKKSFPQSSIKSLHKLAVKKRSREEEIVKDYKEGKIDILLGTQMMAHQAKLPASCFVGIFYPESLLRLADFRAGFKTFKYIREIMSFVKNSENCEFLVQTYLPNSLPIRHAVFEDSSSFYRHEIKTRRLMGYPPFTFLAEVLFYGKDLRSVAKKSRNLLDIVKKEKNNIEVLGPSLAPIKKLRGRNQVQLIVKSNDRNSLDRLLGRIFKDIKIKKSVFIYE